MLSPLQFPGDVVDGQQTVEYTEQLNIGYRWYDANVSGECADGRGRVATRASRSRSATACRTRRSRSSRLQATPRTSDGTRPIRVLATVENTGNVAGAEVVQVYLGVPAAGEPPMRLVAFEKVWLGPGQRKRVRLEIDPAASSHPLDVWDATADTWVAPTGEYQVYVGSSAENAEQITHPITIRDPRRR